MTWKDVIIGIGAVNIAVESHCSCNLELPEIYEKFITDRNPDIILRLHNSDPPFSLPSEKVYSSERLSTYHDGDNLITQFHIRDYRRELRDAVMKANSKEKVVDFYTTYLHPLKRFFFRYILATILASGLGVMIHGAGIVDDENVLMCAGLSGAGKSTMAALWKYRNCTVLSDDTLIVRKGRPPYLVYGTPWVKDTEMSSPQEFPLKAIFFIEHAPRNFLEPQKGTLATMLRHTFCPRWDGAGMVFTMEFLSELMIDIPCYRLGFVPAESIVDVMREISLGL
ncbi:MAG: hypothetical protein HXS41_06425 [Theionarchaea archaeon]|nr:hypothetical protein [Theionarchaea archaeon]MBU6999699.1 hypothetical protein [Theionarchaea archaeon]MBU7020675.1 hypothetical protein [Theionarchaea archaeon]MBU7034641.1 hypothetical protein [Theionarchaea archaeon]MBU7039849.1 hypothetical protein [Theionarchaea archaeon]